MIDIEEWEGSSAGLSSKDSIERYSSSLLEIDIWVDNAGTLLVDAVATEGGFSATFGVGLTDGGAVDFLKENLDLAAF